MKRILKFQGLFVSVLAALLFFSGNARTTDGTSDYLQYTANSGQAQLVAEGNWGTATTVQLMFKTTAGATGQEVRNIDLSASDPSKSFDVSVGEYLAAKVENAGGGTSLKIKVLPLP